MKKRTTKNPSRSDLDLLPQPKNRESDGQPLEHLGRFCGCCLLPLESTLQGLNARHVGSNIPYGQCPQALREMTKWR